MTGLVGIPPELLFLITAYLQPDDTKALRLACKSLDQQLRDEYTKQLFQCRTYYATIPDLQALLELSRHPSGANLLLKRLRIDVASPYIHIRPNLLLSSLASGEDDEEELRPPKLFNQTCFAADCYNFEGLKQCEDQALIFAALQNLPNLETVEFIDRRGIPSDKSLAKHYPTLVPEHKEAFIQFFKEHAIRQKRDRMTALLFHVMTALKHSPARIRELIVESPRHGYMYTSLGWFDSHRRHIKDLGEPLKKLKTLELNLCYPWPPEDERDFDEFGPIKLTEAELQCLPNFLTKTTPNVENLKLMYAEILPELNSNSLFVWVHREERKYEPTLYLKNVELKLPKLKRLQLIGIPFIPDELIEVLLRPHRSTLRHLRLEDCVLQETPQYWSTIFALLKEELKLETFSFFTNTIDSRTRLTDKMPIIFTVEGDVHSPSHKCSICVSRSRPITHTTFWEALDMTVDFEAKLLNPETHKNPSDTDSGNSSDDSDDDDSLWNNPFGDNPVWANPPGAPWDFDDDLADIVDDNIIAPALPFPPPGLMGPPPPFPIPHINLPPLNPPPLNPVEQTENYTAQGNLPIHNHSTLDTTGSLRPAGNLMVTLSNLPPGSVLVRNFVIPGNLLDREALDGLPCTTQNVLNNLLPGALDVGVSNQSAGNNQENEDEDDDDFQNDLVGGGIFSSAPAPPSDVHDHCHQQ